ncbi:hypothetical protein L208DRAFT_1457127, partial [Tricholoma matsutake]
SSPAPAPAVEVPAPPPANARGNQKQRGGPAARGGKYYSRGGANKSTPKDANLNQNGVVEEPVASEGQRRSDGRGRGRGARGSGPQRGGRRPFDRHSQTGKTDSDKKLHQSWGGDDGNAELKTEQAATNDAAAEGAGTNDWSVDSAPAEAWGSPAATPTADAWGTPETAPGADAWSAPVADTTAPPEADKPEGRPRREREPEEEDNTLTLEQYLAQQKEKESVIPKLEATRKANEGADANIWKDVVPLQKEDEDAYFVGKIKTAPKARAKKEEKVFLEIEARFERPDRGRGGRGRGDRGGDRGRDRGRGGRGRGARGGRQNANSAVDVNDAAAFPSLS